MISIQFFGLIILLLVPYWLIPKQRIRNVLLGIGSLFYIYTLDANALGVVIALSSFSYLMGILIGKTQIKKYLI